MHRDGPLVVLGGGPNVGQVGDDLERLGHASRSARVVIPIQVQRLGARIVCAVEPVVQPVDQLNL